MKKYEIKIKGVADMLQNRLSKDLIDEIKQIPNAKKEEWEEENWEKKLYKLKVDGEERITVPDLVIYSFLQEACKKYKVPPPKSIGRTWTAYCKSSVLVLEPAILDDVKIEPFGCMVNGSPSTSKGSSKVYRIRPRIEKGWTTTIRIMDTAGYLNKEVVGEVLKCGGMFVGLCDWRPLHGRFEVLDIKEVD